MRTTQEARRGSGDGEGRMEATGGGGDEGHSEVTIDLLPATVLMASAVRMHRQEPERKIGAGHVRERAGGREIHMREREAGWRLAGRVGIRV